MNKIELTEDLEKKIREGINKLETYESVDIEEIVTDIVGSPCSIYEEWIDDGCDGGEDEYVMKGCFEIENSDIIIRVYFGNNTREIGYVDINEN